MKIFFVVFIISFLTTLSSITVQNNIIEMDTVINGTTIPLFASLNFTVDSDNNTITFYVSFPNFGIQFF